MIARGQAPGLGEDDAGRQEDLEAQLEAHEDPGSTHDSQDPIPVGGQPKGTFGPGPAAWRRR